MHPLPRPRVLFEDESLIAVDKEAGHLVHPADIPQPDDLVTMKIVRDHVGEKIFPTHRLDRPTCGVLLFAKNKTVARALNRAFERKQVDKTYQAIVNGHPQHESWSCDEPLQKSENLPFKAALTDFRILQKLTSQYTLIEASPLTGRYHQIRKHLQHCAHPIVGDYRYADHALCLQQENEFNSEKRMLLQCKTLRFLHPHRKEPLSITAPDDPCFGLGER